MSEQLNLKLDFLDASSSDSLRGPGSPSSEQIPTASSVFQSPFPSSFGSYRNILPERTASASIVDVSTAEKADSEIDVEEAKEDGLHVVVVGGNIGAYVTSLALAKSEKIRVTLVNVGVGPFTALGNESAAEVSLLPTRIISHLNELGKRDGQDVTDNQGLQMNVPFDLSGRSSRWKGKGPAGHSSNIGEMVQQDGVRLDAFALQRYSDGDLLTFQEYSISGEKVPVTAINTDAFLAILRDTCLAHPRIDVRPRAVVLSVLPGSPPTSSLPFTAGDVRSLQSKARDEASPEENNKTASNGRETKHNVIGRRPEVSTRDRERRRKARESFIQLDDDEHESPLPSFSALSSIASTPLSGDGTSLDEFLKNIPSESRSSDPFSTEDLTEEAPPDTAKLDAGFDIEKEDYNPAVVLTSGERVQADAIIGTEGPLSKVLEVIQSEQGHVYYCQTPHDDGVYKAIIPAAILIHEPELSSLFWRGQDSGVSVTWPGPGRFLTVYPLNHNFLYLSLTVKGNRVRNDILIGADETMLANQMRYEVIGWCFAVQKLVSFVESATYEPVCDYNQLEQWASHSGRVAALGNAAHPFKSSLHQSLEATISDALTLGELFHRSLARPLYPGGLRSPHLIPRLLNTLTTVRRPICLSTQLTLREGRALFFLEDGERQKTRDRTIKNTGLFREGEKRRAWYEDPLQGVEEWWGGEIRRFVRAMEEGF